MNNYGISSAMGNPGSWNWWSILAAIIFSIIGWCAFRFGKREGNMRPIILGITLMVYPYFISNTWVMLLIGIALTAALFIWRS